MGDAKWKDDDNAQVAVGTQTFVQRQNPDLSDVDGKISGLLIDFIDDMEKYAGDRLLDDDGGNGITSRNRGGSLETGFENFDGILRSMVRILKKVIHNIRNGNKDERKILNEITFSKENEPDVTVPIETNTITEDGAYTLFHGKLAAEESFSIADVELWVDSFPPDSFTDCDGGDATTSTWDYLDGGDATTTGATSYDGGTYTKRLMATLPGNIEIELVSNK